ncbi:MAG: hypothetical protein DF168_01203 [Candidatus Moanabacter tarae]|uniref:Uncharacterized protein n=1 Tax=Candidatus Moanibacter tarae TaxID=2200854 RepID=A0A2Z4AI41_9BACT|nr:MAG: hypothetical protein DF168_01203 [Candidatus Moanabacter tarae]
MCPALGRLGESQWCRQESARKVATILEYEVSALARKLSDECQFLSYDDLEYNLIVAIICKLASKRFWPINLSRKDGSSFLINVSTKGNFDSVYVTNNHTIEYYRNFLSIL